MQTGKEWCLLNYKEIYYYTPKMYIEFPKNDTNDDDIKVSSFLKKAVSETSEKEESTESNDENTNNEEQKYKKLASYDNPSIYAKLRLGPGFHTYNTPLYEYPDPSTASCTISDRGLSINKAPDTLIPIQSKWEHIETGRTYYCTTFFSKTADETLYIPARDSDFVPLSQLSATDDTQYVALCCEQSPMYTEFMNTSIHKYIVGDIFYTSKKQVSKFDNNFYQMVEIGGNVYSVRPDLSKFSPFAHNANVFDKKYYGKITNNGKLSCRSKTIQLSQQWSEYNDGKPVLISAEYFDWFIDTDLTEAMPGVQTFLKWRPITEEGFSANSITTVNRISKNGKYYWFGFCSKDPARRWVIIEDDGKLNWSAIDNSYTMNETTIFQQATYSATSDIQTSYTVSEGVENKGGSISVEESASYLKKVSDNKNGDSSKFVEPWYDVTIDPGDSSYDIPGIIKDASELPPDWYGWPHLDDAMKYELREMDARNYGDDRHLRKINRFRLQNNDAGLSTKSFIFVTRPDLNLYKEVKSTNNPAEDTVDETELNPDLERLPTFSYVANMKNACRTIFPSLEYYGTNSINSPWLAVMHNQAIGYSPIEREMDYVEVGETFHGSKVLYAEPTFRHKIAGTVSIPFVERRDLSLYYTLKIWIEYIQMVSLGRCSPRRIHIMNQELDYAVSLYYITTDETMENIIYWEKLTGLFPLTVPDDFFSWTKGQPARDMEYTIRFAYSMRTVQDEMHLAEINNLYERFKSSSGAKGEYSDYGYSYDPKFNHIMAKVASSYGVIPETDDEAIAHYATLQDSMKNFYYGNVKRENSSQAFTNGYDQYLVDRNTGETILKKNQYLPNFIPSIGMHGVPYVKGPFITLEPDRYESPAEGFGTPINNGIYKLRWV